MYLYDKRNSSIIFLFIVPVIEFTLGMNAVPKDLKIARASQS